jgi:flavin reductase
MSGRQAGRLRRAEIGMTTVTGERFREGMRRLGAAVHIVATAGPGGRSGFTASAACPVTDEPPMLLVCLNRSSGLNAAFRANGVLSVNTLAAGHEAISDVFAGRAGADLDARFEHGVWTELVTGAPILCDSLASFDCELAEIKEVGTHSVMFGAVRAVRLSEPGGAPALLYLNRGYRRLALQD